MTWAGACRPKSGSSRADVRVNGLIFCNLGDIQRVLPTGDGATAWAVNSKGVAVIDRYGNVLKQISIPADALQHSDDRTLVSAGPTALWVPDLRHGRAYYITAQGQATEIKLDLKKLQQHFGLDSDSATVSPDGKTAWLGGPFDHAIVSLDAAGSAHVTEITLQTHYTSWRSFGGKGTPDNHHHWFGLQAANAGSGTDRQSWMFLADAGGSVADVTESFYADVDLEEGVFPGDGAFWCAPGKSKGVYCIRQDGTRLGAGGRLFADVAVRKLALASDGKTVYLMPKGKGLFSFDPERDLSLAVLLTDRSVDRTVTTPLGTLALGDGHALLLGHEKPVELDGSPVWSEVRGAVASHDGRYWWLVGQSGQVWAMSEKGQLQNRATAIDSVELASPSGLGDDPETRILLTVDSLAPFGDSGLLGWIKNKLIWMRPDGTALSVGSDDGRSTKSGAKPEVSPDAKYAWIYTSGRLAVLSPGGRLITGDLRQSGLIDYGAVYPAADGKHAWTGGGWVLGGAWTLTALDSPADLSKAEVRLAEGLPGLAAKLDALHPGTPVLPIDPTGKRWSYQLDWPGHDRSASGGTAQISLSRAGHEFAKAAFADEDTVASTFKEKVAFDKSTQVQLLYTDPAGARLEVAWPSVIFSVPIWRRPVFLTVCWFLVIAAISALFIRRRVRIPVARDWIPLLIWSGSGATAASGWLAKVLGIDTELMLILLGVAFAATALVGAYSPSVFRDLAQVEPFRRIAPLLLTRASIRKRFYAEYIGGMRRALGASRKSAFDEAYVAIPAAVRLPDGREEQADRPAVSVAGWLSADSATGFNVLVSAPGGRGKSALVRESVTLLLRRFEEQPSGALPVMCEWREEYGKLAPLEVLKSAVARALGRHLLIPDALEAQLRGGDFIVVIDGLSDLGVSPDTLQAWFVSDYGDRVRFLLATRPDDRYEKALAATEYCRATPLRLDEKTITVFEKHYFDEDSKRKDRNPSLLSPMLKSVCRTADGTYLPILVRLAVGFGGSAGSIRGVYELTIARLLKQPDGAEDTKTVDAAVRLCFETYWKTGVRTVRWSSGDDSRQQLIRKLYDAGLMVSADEGPAIFQDHPRQVRFFHDSIQSFLTARALDARIRETGEWTILEEAAGHPRFVRAQSDLLTQGGSEVFQFCAYLLDAEPMLRELAAQIEAWANEFDRDLTKNDVAQSVTESRRDMFEARLMRDDPPGKALRLALSVCDAVGSERLACVVTLYGRMAPIIWPLRERKKLAAQKSA